MVAPLPAPRGECCVVQGNHGNSIHLARDSFRAGPIRNGNFCGGWVASRKGFPPEIIESKRGIPFSMVGSVVHVIPGAQVVLLHHQTSVTRTQQVEGG